LSIISLVGLHLRIKVEMGHVAHVARVPKMQMVVAGFEGFRGFKTCNWNKQKEDRAMKPLRTILAACALILVSAGVNPLQAAWCNAFQVCWHKHCQSQSSSYYSGDACCNPCPPQPCCTTQYKIRCYYQPVTRYETRTYYEPVTTYRTSYYWEPVTSYRYSMYYDPCTCSYQQQACPQTCYRLRSQCCPVQSWVARCCTVPVTTQQQMFYYEPVTSCCTPAPANPCPSTAPSSSPAVPGVQEQRSTATPGVSGVNLSPPAYLSPTDNNSYRQPVSPATNSAPSPPPPTVKLDKVVYYSKPNVEGQVVSQDQAPRPGAKILFVSLDKQGARQTVTADAAGKFQADLTYGSWLVYLHDAADSPVFQRKLDVRAQETNEVTLRTSR
jgi:hypothetical protein